LRPQVRVSVTADKRLTINHSYDRASKQLAAGVRDLIGMAGKAMPVFKGTAVVYEDASGDLVVSGDESAVKAVKDVLADGVAEIVKIQDAQKDVTRYESLAKSAGDREMSQYYTARAAESRDLASKLVPGTVTFPVKNQVVAKSAAADNLTRELKARNRQGEPGGDHVDETYRKGLESQAAGEERLALECDRKVEELTQSMLRAPSDLVGYYSGKQQEHRAMAAMHRSRAAAHRSAIAALGI
jgi:hypothetical protein